MPHNEKGLLSAVEREKTAGNRWWTARVNARGKETKPPQGGRASPIRV